MSPITVMMTTSSASSRGAASRLRQRQRQRRARPSLALVPAAQPVGRHLRHQRIPEQLPPRSSRPPSPAFTVSEDEGPSSEDEAAGVSTTGIVLAYYPAEQVDFDGGLAHVVANTPSSGDCVPTSGGGDRVPPHLRAALSRLTSPGLSDRHAPMLFVHSMPVQAHACSTATAYGSHTLPRRTLPAVTLWRSLVAATWR